MYKKVKDLGVNVRFNSNVTDISLDENFIIINKNEKIYFNNLIDGSGTNSLLRKKLNLKSEIGIGIKYWFKKK